VSSTTVEKRSGACQKSGKGMDRHSLVEKKDLSKACWKGMDMLVELAENGNGQTQRQARGSYIHEGDKAGRLPRWKCKDPSSRLGAAKSMFRTETDLPR
jgi:hypothetical protein